MSEHKHLWVHSFAHGDYDFCFDQPCRARRECDGRGGPAHDNKEADLTDGQDSRDQG